MGAGKHSKKGKEGSKRVFGDLWSTSRCSGWAGELAGRTLSEVVFSLCALRCSVCERIEARAKRVEDGEREILAVRDAGSYSCWADELSGRTLNGMVFSLGVSAYAAHVRAETRAKAMKGNEREVFEVQSNGSEALWRFGAFGKNWELQKKKVDDM